MLFQKLVLKAHSMNITN